MCPPRNANGQSNSPDMIDTRLTGAGTRRLLLPVLRNPHKYGFALRSALEDKWAIPGNRVALEKFLDHHIALAQRHALQLRALLPDIDF